jgi:hypothetical protein
MFPPRKRVDESAREVDVLARCHRHPCSPSGASVALLVVACVSPFNAAAFPSLPGVDGQQCQTCHVAGTLLTNAGEAFKNNNYRWPAPRGETGLDAERSASTGVSGERRLGALVEVGPAGFGADWVPLRSPEPFDGSPDLDRGDIGFEEAFVEFRIAAGLDARVGRFPPALFSFGPRGLAGENWMFTRAPGEAGSALAGREGVELRSASVSGRLLMVAGAAGSPGVVNATDGWARVGWKFGGVRLDGADQRADAGESSHPWRDDSVLVSLSGYHGAAQNDAAFVDSFDQAGVEANLWAGNAHLLAATTVARHSQIAPEGDPLWVWNALAQLDVVAAPWLVPSVRAEWTSTPSVRVNASTDAPWHVDVGATVPLLPIVSGGAFLECGPSALSPVAPIAVRLSASSSF